jgi:Zn-dependent protease with chaperone function
LVNVHYGAVTLAETSGTISFTCPQCSWTGEFDLRYTTWCRRCEHGLSALSAEEIAERGREKGRDRRRREAARKRAENMEARLAKVEDLRPGGGVRIAAMTAATLVHLMGLAVLAVGVWLLTLGVITAYVAGALLLGVAWVVRPRIGRLDKETDWKRREDLPLFFGLLDRTAASVGAPVPQVVSLTAIYPRGGAFFNAGTARKGLRRTPVLIMGIPLWQVLSRQERLALLGHELGHQVNGDTTGSLFVGSARVSLQNWQHLFTPPGAQARVNWGRASRMGRGRLTELLATLAMLPFYFAALLLVRLFGWIDIHVRLRAEYLADEIAARVAGTEAVVGVMRKLSIGRTVVLHLNREKARHGMVGRRVSASGRSAAEAAAAGAAVWTNLATYLGEVPEHEYERQVRVSEFRGTAVDSDHPASYLRTRLLRDRPLRDAALSLSAEEWEAVEKELDPYVAAGGLALIG